MATKKNTRVDFSQRRYGYSYDTRWMDLEDGEIMVFNTRIGVINPYGDLLEDFISALRDAADGLIDCTIEITDQGDYGYGDGIVIIGKREPTDDERKKYHTEIAKREEKNAAERAKRRAANKVAKDKKEAEALEIVRKLGRLKDE